MIRNEGEAKALMKLTNEKLAAIEERKDLDADTREVLHMMAEILQFLIPARPFYDYGR